MRRLLGDAGIIRHRGKIESTINNARRALELRRRAASLRHVWAYEPAARDRPRRMTYSTLMSLATSPASISLSRDLKKRGWTFVGPTTLYAFMQAMGLVNHHLDGCAMRAECEGERGAFRRPGGRTAMYRS